MKVNLLKYFILFGLIFISFTGVYYLNLPVQTKARVKTKINHVLGLVDNTWDIKAYPNETALTTPTLVIDDIYKSMEGPPVAKHFQLDNSRNDLVWINSFEVKVIGTNEIKELSNDFICHTNVDFYDGEHYARWNLDNRAGFIYPRLTTMTNGIESYKLPTGFGFPVFTNENLFLTTQALNHNIKSANIPLKHKISIGYETHNKLIKPLDSKTIFIRLPYNPENPYEGPTDSNPNVCLPVNTKLHTYEKDGEVLSGHWVVFPGKETFKYDVTHQLMLKDSTTMHFIATHLHPYAESLAFRDKTADSTLFNSIVKNHKDKIGLKDVSIFSNEKGIMLYPDHDYELVLETNNTSGIEQDMMGSMFVFLYDKEMHDKIKKYNSSK